MNFLILLVESLLIYAMMFLFFKQERKEGLYIYIAILSGILSIVSYECVNIFGFEVNMGLPIIMGIFISNNLIIQRYGLDEVKRIIKTFVISGVLVYFFVNIIGFMMDSSFNIVTNATFDSLFSYNIRSVRVFISLVLSISFLLWYNGNIYYYIRRSRNKILFSNIGSILIIQFIESIMFIFIAYLFVYDITSLFGMLVIRYLVKVVLGAIGVIPLYVMAKMKD